MEIRIFSNRIRVTNIESGRSTERVADTPFSTEEMLVADAVPLATLVRAAVVDLERGARLLMLPTATIIPMEGLSQVERYVLKDMGDALGFRKVRIAD